MRLIKLEVAVLFGGGFLWYFPNKRDSMKVVCMKQIICISKVRVLYPDKTSCHKRDISASFDL